MRQSRSDRHTPFVRWRLLALLPALFALAGMARAQTTDGDPPDRVARLSYLAGDVGFLPQGAQDWSDASVNRPLTRGDRLTAGDDARVELELDRAALRLDRDTDLGVLRLDDQVAQFELTRGTASLSVRALAPGESYEIDTPRVALVVDQPGTFRIDVDARDGDTEITAFDGQATVYGNNQAMRRLVGGHTYRFDDSSLAQVDESYAGSRDAFDVWSADRDQRYADVQSGHYVSEQVIGYQDLDDYGRWQDDDQYGEVWYPSDVAAGWAPYRFGHWAYVAPWGWTWIDDAPWGFAPYHYGRWVYVRDRWGWIPGPRDLRPIYAPALVAFIGGNGWSASVGAGPPIGWFPLGPGDFYDPWYPVSMGYYRRVNDDDRHWDHDRRHDRDGRDGHEAYERYFNERWQRYHAGRDPGMDYNHERPPHGITAMSREAFAEARPVQTHRMHLGAAEARDAAILVGASRLPGARAPATRVRRMPSRAAGTGGFERPVVMHRASELPAGERVFRAGAPEARPTVLPGERRTGSPDELSGVPAARGRHDPIGAPPSRPDGGYGRHLATLPAVPRFVQQPVAPRAEPDVPRERSMQARPQERTLPVPPRFEQARPVAAESRRWSSPEPRVVQAPVERPPSRPSPPVRLEARRPAMDEIVPQPRRFEPAPRSYTPPPAPPRPAPSSHPAQQNRSAPPPRREHENPGAERFQHR